MGTKCEMFSESREVFSESALSSLFNRVLKSPLLMVSEKSEK